MENTFHSSLADKLIWYKISIGGTRSYWTKSCVELTHLLHQIRSHTRFLTLSAINIYWTDLHTLMPGKIPDDTLKAHNWKRQNVIGEFFLEKGMHVKEFWC